MDNADQVRSLQMVDDVLGWCQEYFSKNSEANVAEHVNKKVFYSPICQQIADAQLKLGFVMDELGTTHG